MNLDLIINLFFSIINILPIYLIASLGGYLSQRVGVYDVSMEGNMTLGCVLGIIGYVLTKSPWVGMLFGFLGGCAVGLILATFTTKLNLNQIITGFGLWFFCTGLSSFLYKIYVPSDQLTKAFPTLAELFGFHGELNGLLRFLELDIIFYLSILLLLSVSFVVYHTKLGIFMRAVGENPDVVDAAGINVFKIRYFSILIGTGVVGLAGSYLSIDFLQGYTHGMVAGRGWIAFAIIIFSKWKPLNILWGCLLFAGVNGLQIRFQTIGIQLSSEFLTALPYIVTIVVLAMTMRGGKNSRMAPSALGKPYFRE